MSRQSSKVSSLLLFSLISPSLFGVAPVSFVSSELALSPLIQWMQRGEWDQARKYCAEQVPPLPLSDMQDCAFVAYWNEDVAAADAWMRRLESRPHGLRWYLLKSYQDVVHGHAARARQTLQRVLGHPTKGTQVGNEAQWLSALSYEKEGQTDTAGFLYKMLADTNPDFVPAQLGLSRYYVVKQNWPAAAQHLAQVARAWPHDIASRYALAQLNLQQKNFDQAGYWLSETYRLNRGDAAVLTLVGNYFEQKKQIGLAVRFWQRALSVQKNSPEAESKLAHYANEVVDALMQAHDYGPALKNLEKFAPHPEAQPSLLLKRAQLRRHVGLFAAAAGDAKKVLAMDRANAVAWQELGIDYLNLKIKRQALDCFAEAARLNPKEGMSHAWMAFLLETEHDWEGARAQWSTAVDLITEPEALARASRHLATVTEKIKSQHDEQAKEERGQ